MDGRSNGKGSWSASIPTRLSEPHRPPQIACTSFCSPRRSIRSRFISRVNSCQTSTPPTGSARPPRANGRLAEWAASLRVVRVCSKWACDLVAHAMFDHLRHSKFAGLREDKDARTVIKEHGGEG